MLVKIFVYIRCACSRNQTREFEEKNQSRFNTSNLNNDSVL